MVVLAAQLNLNSSPSPSYPHRPDGCARVTVVLDVAVGPAGVCVCVCVCVYVSERASERRSRRQMCLCEPGTRVMIPHAAAACILKTHTHARTAFILDRRIDAGASAGHWLDNDEYQGACVGVRPVTAPEAFKALRQLLALMLDPCLHPTGDSPGAPAAVRATKFCSTGLTRGADSCDATMNFYAGVRKAHVTGPTVTPTSAPASGSTRQAAPSAAVE